MPNTEPKLKISMDLPIELYIEEYRKLSNEDKIEHVEAFLKSVKSRVEESK